MRAAGIVGRKHYSRLAGKISDAAVPLIWRTVGGRPTPLGISPNRADIGRDLEGERVSRFTQAIVNVHADINVIEVRDSVSRALFLAVNEDRHAVPDAEPRPIPAVRVRDNEC